MNVHRLGTRDTFCVKRNSKHVIVNFVHESTVHVQNLWNGTSNWSHNNAGCWWKSISILKCFKNGDNRFSQFEWSDWLRHTNGSWGLNSRKPYSKTNALQETGDLTLNSTLTRRNFQPMWYRNGVKSHRVTTEGRWICQVRSLIWSQSLSKIKRNRTGTFLSVYQEIVYTLGTDNMTGNVFDKGISMAILYTGNSMR